MDDIEKRARALLEKNCEGYRTRTTWEQLPEWSRQMYREHIMKQDEQKLPTTTNGVIEK